MARDASGVPIEDITSACSGVNIIYRLNRPARCSFQVDSEDPKVATIQADGFNTLEPGVRQLLAYRKEGDAYVLRFAGVIWKLQDAGDTDKVTTGVECYDPSIVLNKRHVADAAGNPNRVPYVNTNGAAIAKEQIDRTNAAAATGLTAAAVVPSTPTRTVTYEWRTIASAVTELATAFNGFDMDVVPIDDQGVVIGRMDFYAKKGTNRPEALFGWDAGPRNVKRVERLTDMDPVANNIIGLGATATGGGQITSIQQSVDSINVYRLLSTVEVFQDIYEQVFLDALVADELNFRLARRELIQFVPQPGNAPEPFTDFALGDYVPLYASARLRGGFQGIVRVFGFDIVLDEDGREIINGIYCQEGG